MSSTGIEHPLPAGVRDFLRTCSQPSGVTAAVSGGSDSTALLLALSEACAELGLACAAVHVDHGLRQAAEAEAEADFLTELCSSLGISLRILAIDRGLIDAEVRQSGSSPEDAARRRRYALLEGESGLVALGHTADDAIEGQIMNFFRGSDPCSLHGIVARRGNFIRPLLAFHREDLRAYLRERRCSWMEDSSNGDERFLRNKVRRRLLPVVREVFPGFERALASLAEKARVHDEFFGLMERERLFWSSHELGLAVDVGAWNESTPLLRMRQCYQAFDRLMRAADGERRLPFAFLRPVLYNPARADDGVMLEGHGMRLERRAGFVVARPLVARRGKMGYLFKVDKSMYGKVLNMMEIELRPSDNGACTVPRGSVIRSRRAGDSVAVHGRSRSLKRLLSAAGIEENMRHLVAVVHYGAEILGYIGPDGSANLRPSREPCVTGLMNVRISLTHNSGDSRE